MMVILFIPLGILCFILAYQCLRAEYKVKALWCTALGIFFLCSAAFMGYGACVLLQNIEPKNFDRSASATLSTATKS
ncbi:MAG: hypothetical protein RBR43_08745 [Desulfuromonadaceae bacterium]|nr:hypothetical protein [Desulfuromonas sp.]MDY0185950.1 hypothetical protein [Desulfuromonadaceae bacterium]